VWSNTLRKPDTILAYAINIGRAHATALSVDTIAALLVRGDMNEVWFSGHFKPFRCFDEAANN